MNSQGKVWENPKPSEKAPAQNSSIPAFRVSHSFSRHVQTVQVAVYTLTRSSKLIYATDLTRPLSAGRESLRRSSLKLAGPTLKKSAGNRLSVLETLAAWRAVSVKEMAERLLAMRAKQLKAELQHCASASHQRQQLKQAEGKQ